MDDDLVAFSADQHDEFEKVPCGVRSEDQPAVGVFAKIVDHQGVPCPPAIGFDRCVDVRLMRCVQAEGTRIGAGWDTMAG